MRPSMRLPLREANFICSSCRIGATPRISPLGQVRHYASDSPGILERARRKLWGTDNPPGPADPYSGSQIMSGMEGEKPKADEAFGLEEGQALPEKAPEAMTWDGMPKIGYLKEEEWRIKGSKELVDEVTPWYYNPEPLPFEKAAYQTAMEIGLYRQQKRELYRTSKDRLHPKNKLQMRNLSLADGNFKFAFFTRLSKLTSQHIPDSIISSTTIGEALDRHEELRKKNTKLTPVLLHELMDKNGAAGLSNVKILDVRQTRQHNDEDFGRKKAIISALYKSGLINKSLGRKHKQPRMQTNEKVDA